MKYPKVILFFILSLAVVSTLVACSVEIPIDRETEPAVTTGKTSTDTEKSTDSPETDPGVQTEYEFVTDYGVYDATVSVPRFSVRGGFVTSAFDLAIAPPEGVKGVSVHYTTDGSVPTARSRKYSSPLHILGTGKAAVIRAACFDSLNNRVGYVATQTYYLFPEGTSFAYTVSIVTDASDFDRIVQNYNLDTEISAHIEIVTQDGTLAVSQDGGLEIFGGSTRSLEQKSFKISAHKTESFSEGYFYGTGNFKYPFFENNLIRAGEDAGQILTKYDSLILRNGGNDSALRRGVDTLRPSLLRDNIANLFALEVSESLDCADSVFAEVYINGSYYGIFDMKENMNDNHVRRMYGVDADDVAVIKSELDTNRGGRFDGTWFYFESDHAEAIAGWNELCATAASAIGSADAETIYKDISQKIDIKGFIEYTALNLYICNTDWPHNNVKLWKYVGDPIDGIGITDGKWHFMTRDMDFAFAGYDSGETLPELDTCADVDTFYRILGNYVNYSQYYANDGSTRLYPDSLGLQGLFAFCMTIESFRNDFCEYCALISSEESAALLRNILNEQISDVQGGIQNYLTRWSNAIAKGYTVQTWQENTATILDFVDTRSSYFNLYLERAVELIKKGLTA